MNTLQYIIAFTVLGSIVSLVGGIILLMKEKVAIKISPFLAAFAAGALLATAFLDLLPEAVEETQDAAIFIWALVGFLFFFLLERSIHWFHHHHEHPDEDSKPTTTLILVGDSIHNFIDGIAIAASFLIDTNLGIVTALAVGSHEIPQEIGDFGVLLKNGFSRKKVLVYNIISACAALVGALLTYFIGASIENILPVFLAITAGFFIYIAASDLIPEIHDKARRRFAPFLNLTLLGGVFAVSMFILLFEGGGH